MGEIGTTLVIVMGPLGMVVLIVASPALLYRGWKNQPNSFAPPPSIFSLDLESRRVCQRLALVAAVAGAIMIGLHFYLLM